MPKRKSKAVNPDGILADFLSRIESDPFVAPEIAHKEHLPAIDAVYAELNPSLPSSLETSLRDDGLNELYVHQTESINAVRQGKNIVIVTPTASGKTYSYALPILEKVAEDISTRAILLFPLKALAQDQLKRLRKLALTLNPDIRIEIYDGDTPDRERKKMRANPPNLLLTNPDMLHYGILPFHSNWESLFNNLKFVVLDELHTYKGVFGSHVLQIFRRLNRVAGFYHASPQFLTTSATIDNPRELAEALTGEKFELIDKSGAPSAARSFYFINPRNSVYTAATRLITSAIENNLKTICFTKARKITELIHRWTISANPELTDRISAYRSGYLPQERRQIEKSLRDGDVDAVISTSALEMGIDIGGLDVCILVGYPGTISTTWQRAGRVGRKARDSVIFMLALPDALDQYYMRNPDDFFRRTAEAAVVDDSNEYLLRNHLICAAQEVPLKKNEKIFSYEKHKNVINKLVEEGELAEAAGGRFWFSNRKRPQRNIDIRGAGTNTTVLNKQTKRIIGTVSGWQAMSECHPGAIYMHRAQTFLVEELNLGKKEAWAHKVDVPYYTRAKSEKDTEILEIFKERELERYKVSLGKVKVTEQVIGYERRSVSGREKISEHTLDLPPVIYETIALWIQPPATAVGGLVDEKYHAMGSLHALEHASLALMPIFALCDRNDLGGISFTHHPQCKSAAVFLYDGHPGGVGLANRAYDVFEELMEKVYDLINGCECEDGCPSCIHSPKCGHGNQPLDKRGSIRLLEHITGREELAGEAAHAPQDLDRTVQTYTLDEDGNINIPTLTKSDIEKHETIKKYESQLNLIKDKDIIVFDLETQLSAEEVGGWHNAHLMRVSLGIVYERLTDTYTTYMEENIEELLERMQKADLVVGFNNKKFDNAVLSSYADFDLRGLPNLDILDEIYRAHHFRLSLASLATATFNAGKLGDGLDALRWWKEGKIDQIEKYCKMDVELTARLFDYILENGYALYEKKGSGAVKLPLNIKISKYV